MRHPKFTDKELRKLLRDLRVEDTWLRALVAENLALRKVARAARAFVRDWPMDVRGDLALAVNAYERAKGKVQRGK
jgi:hypothetical protein